VTNSTEYIKKELEKYNVTNTALAKLKDDYMGLKVDAVDDMDNYLVCKEAHQEVKKLRVSVEKKRVELKASSLEFGRAIDGEAKRITMEIEVVEDHLETQRKVVENEKKRKMEEAAREAQEEADRRKKEEEDRIEADRKAEEERLEVVRLEQEAIAKKQREDQEKLDTQQREQDERGRILKEMAERQAREKIEAEEVKKKAEQDELDRIAREKRQAEEVELAKQEAVRQEKIRKEEEEAEKVRVAQEVEKKAEHERQTAPDKEKLHILGQTLADIKFPEVQSPEAKGTLLAVKESMEHLIESLFNAKL